MCHCGHTGRDLQYDVVQHSILFHGQLQAQRREMVHELDHSGSRYSLLHLLLSNDWCSLQAIWSGFSDRWMVFVSQLCRNMCRYLLTRIVKDGHDDLCRVLDTFRKYACLASMDLLHQPRLLCF